MSETGNIIVETATRIFRDLGDPQTLNNAAGTDWKTPLWNALEGSGLTRAWVPDSLNGGGASIADGFEILRIAGSFAVAVPLAETLLAGWVLSQAKLSVPAGGLSVAPARPGDRIQVNPDGTLSGRARAVPFARDAGHIVVSARRGPEAIIALVERERCSIHVAENISGEPRDNLVLENAKPLAAASAPDGFGEEQVFLMGAAVRAAQMGGALEAVLDMSVRYAGERVAFEKPIGKFQSIQHNLARLAGETAAALVAAGSAADAIDSAGIFDAAVFLEIASAKIRVGEAAGKGAAIAHQVHGALGFSAEHVLHRYTQRLWAWRDDFGAESFWAVRLGDLVAAGGADALWPMLAAR